MRFLELSTQATVGFSPRTQTRFPEGANLTLLVPPSPRISPLAQLVSALAYADGRGGDVSLASGSGACAALVMQGRNGATYRLVREYGGRGLLSQLDPSTGSWRELCRDAPDITSFLRSSGGMPTKGQFESVFCVSPAFKPPMADMASGGGFGTPAPARFGGGMGGGLGGFGGGRLSTGGGGFGGQGGFGAGGQSGGFGSQPAARFGTGGFNGQGGFGAGGQSGGFGSQPAARFGTGFPQQQGFVGQQQGFGGGQGGFGGGPAPLPPLPEAEAKALREKLQAELKAAKDMEAWQFELEGLQQKAFQMKGKLADRDKLAEVASSRKAEMDAMGPDMNSRGVEGWLVDRILNMDGAVQRKNATLKELTDESERLEGNLAAVATKPVWMRPQVILAALAGLACMVVGFIFRGEALGFTSLGAIPAFGWAAFTAAKWLDETELERGIRQRLSRISGEVQRVTDTFQREYGEVGPAMEKLGVKSASEILEDRKRRADCRRALEEAEKMLAKFDADPAFVALQKEADEASGRIGELEKLIEEIGPQVTRDSHVAESELKALEARQSGQTSAPPRRSTGEFRMGTGFGQGMQQPQMGGGMGGGMPMGGGMGGDERIPGILKVAVDLLPGTRIENIGQGLKDRVAQYWAAFTGQAGRRVEFGPRAEAVAFSAAGAPIPVQPGEDSDMLYWSVRLAILEKAAPARQVPVVVEDPTGGWPRQRAMLFARALQSLAASTQVIFVSSAPEFAGAQGALRL